MKEITRCWHLFVANLFSLERLLSSVVQQLSLSAWYTVRLAYVCTLPVNFSLDNVFTASSSLRRTRRRSWENFHGRVSKGPRGRGTITMNDWVSLTPKTAHTFVLQFVFEVSSQVQTSFPFPGSAMPYLMFNVQRSTSTRTSPSIPLQGLTWRAQVSA